MTIEQFTASLAQTAPPAQLPPLLRALWHDARGDWNAAHRLAPASDSLEDEWTRIAAALLVRT